MMAPFTEGSGRESLRCVFSFPGSIPPQTPHIACLWPRPSSTMASSQLSSLGGKPCLRFSRSASHSPSSGKIPDPQWDKVYFGRAVIGPDRPSMLDPQRAGMLFAGHPFNAVLCSCPSPGFCHIYSLYTPPQSHCSVSGMGRAKGQWMSKTSLPCGKQFERWARS
jgi:hypothetical protein